jgi:Mrp family chromosome partitioning ATPase
MEPGQPATDGPSDSLGMIRHRWWLVIVAVLLGIAASAGWLRSQEPVWESTTSVLVHPAGQDTNVVGGRTQGEVNLDTEAQLVRSSAVAAGAAQRLAPAPAPAELAQRVRVEVPPNTSVLVITFAAPAPAAAQAGSRAFAEAYLQHREQAALAARDAQLTAIETTLEELDTTLTGINEQLAAALPGTPAAASLSSQREAVSGQITALTERLTGLATDTVTAGAIINEPQLPTEPSRPAPAIVLASGAALGLVVGLGAAWLADRLTRRVRRGADLSRRLGVPVLATLTAADLAPHEEVASPYARAGRVFDRLRNEVISGTGGNVIVVTGPAGGAATRLAATNLAASLSRYGHDAILVATGAAETPLGVAAGAGLSDLLAGRVGLAGALQRAPRHPRLRVMTMGATATATGLLQSPALRSVLSMLATQAGYVVVETPPTTASADAQSLASHADAALLVVEARRTRLADAIDATDQLRRVGTPLLGALLVPAQRRQPAPAPAPPDRRPAARPRPTAPLPPIDADSTTLLIPRVDDRVLDQHPAPGDQPAAAGGPVGR